jgi:CHASE3 domain sensor protein
LKILTADLPEQRQRVDRLRLDVSRIKEIETKEIAARSTGGFSEGAEEFAESRVRDVIQDLRTVTFDLQHTERLQLIDRSEQANLAGRAVIVFTLWATGIAFIVLVGAEVLIRGDVSRRQRK